MKAVMKTSSHENVVMKKLVVNGCGHKKLVANNFPMKIAGEFPAT